MKTKNNTIGVTALTMHILHRFIFVFGAISDLGRKKKGDNGFESVCLAICRNWKQKKEKGTTDLSSVVWNNNVGKMKRILNLCLH